MRKTASKRLSRAVRSIAEWCRNNRHCPVCEQHAILSQKVRGHYAYYGITGNISDVEGVPACSPTRLAVVALPPQSSARQGLGSIQRLLKRYGLPSPRIVHSYVK